MQGRNSSAAVSTRLRAPLPQSSSLADFIWNASGTIAPGTNLLPNSPDSRGPNRCPAPVNTGRCASLRGCVWDASICFGRARSAHLTREIAQLFEVFLRVKWTLNLRVGGSIPPRLTTRYQSTYGDLLSASEASRMRLGCGWMRVVEQIRRACPSTHQAASARTPAA